MDIPTAQLAHAVAAVAAEVERTGLTINGLQVNGLASMYSKTGARILVAVHARSESDARTLALLWGAEEREVDEHLVYLHADWPLMDIHVEVFGHRDHALPADCDSADVEALV
jgi:hypothetical protein